jgi:hypothetical protein
MTGASARELQADGLRVVHERLFDAMADVPVALRRGRIRRVFVLAVVSTAGLEGGPPLDAPFRAIQVSDLVDSCVAIVESPASARTIAALAAPEAPAVAEAPEVGAQPVTETSEGGHGAGGAVTSSSRGTGGATTRKEPRR